MAFLKQTLTLSTVGASLITSNSFWFFDFFGIRSIQTDLTAEQIAGPSQVSIRRSTADMNRFSTAPKHDDISGSSLKNVNLKTGTVFHDIGVDIILEDLKENKNKHIYKITSITLDDFTLTRFKATEQNYFDFPKNEIKISLFSKAAWYSETGEDEYLTKLSEEQIQELFGDKDEAKVKQLLLSLHKRLDWKKPDFDRDKPPTRFISKLVYPENLDPLRELKIKYFENFEALKDYVHTKVTTCVGEIACVADQRELNIMETDLPSFFEELEKAKASKGK